MLQNAYFLAKIDADTAEKEQHFAEILPKIGNRGSGGGSPGGGRPGGGPRGARATSFEPSGLRVGTFCTVCTVCKFLQNFAKFWRARSRLYQNEILQENMRLTAFFKIYQILKLKFLKFDKILQILRHLQFLAIFC